MSDLLSSIQQVMSRFDSFFQFLERSTLTSIYNFHLWFKHAEYSFKSLSEHAYQFLFNNVNTTDFDDAILASFKIIYNDCWRVRRSNMRESYIKRLLNWFWLLKRNIIKVIKTKGKIIFTVKDNPIARFPFLSNHQTDLSGLFLHFQSNITSNLVFKKFIR